MKDREAWHAAVHGVANGLTRLSDGQQVSSQRDFQFPSWLLLRCIDCSRYLLPMCLQIFLFPLLLIYSFVPL